MSSWTADIFTASYYCTTTRHIFTHEVVCPLYYGIPQIIQSHFTDHSTGTEEHQKVSELLSKAWGGIEPNLEGFAIQIFRLMFKRDPGLFPLFPFFKDEWSRVAYTDYNGGYPEQPPQSWFVVFR